MPSSAWQEWLTRIARTLNEAIFGNLNVVRDVTLEVGATETVVIDDRIGVFSWVLPMPLTESAAGVAGPGGMWLEPKSGQVVIHHDASSATDRHFRLAIFG